MRCWGRIGLAVAGGTGVLAFDYISASGVPVLDVICSILTGSAFVAFLFAAGLALCVSTAGAVLYGALASRDDARAATCAEGADADAPAGATGAAQTDVARIAADADGHAAVRPRPLTAFLWGWATALVALVCLMIVALGILSAVQVGSMSSKLPGLPIIVVGVIGFAAFLGTLLGAASMVVCACVARWRAGHSLEMALVVAVAACGAVVAALTVGTFSALNVASISLPALGGWFAADVVANVAMLFGAKVYADKMSLAS
ncbi:MAG TPA: hypothetical protein OIL80_06310 [Adlercreutzia equolifaciens]|uniref:hypothetical protein n=1 Tax=Adlercreutzia equolifaciens TaxID=446660 RepID=UPI0024308F80|nr:hypothetical protein [Adlercreutzia equolifaciens]HJI12326.1 hypothetical protein [Adlercreutzia equolifaciens]